MLDKGKGADSDRCWCATGVCEQGCASGRKLCLDKAKCRRAVQARGKTTRGDRPNGHVIMAQGHPITHRARANGRQPHKTAFWPKRRLVGLSAIGARPVRDGVTLRHNDMPVGSVTSGGFAPSLDRPAALGFVEAEFAAAGTSLFADTRGTPTAITVSPLPFVQHQYFR